jgi:hypothetical protein
LHVRLNRFVKIKKSILIGSVFLFGTLIGVLLCYVYIHKYVNIQQQAPKETTQENAKKDAQNLKIQAQSERIKIYFMEKEGCRYGDVFGFESFYNAEGKLLIDRDAYLSNLLTEGENDLWKSLSIEYPKRENLKGVAGIHLTGCPRYVHFDDGGIVIAAHVYEFEDGTEKYDPIFATTKFPAENPIWHNVDQSIKHEIDYFYADDTAGFVYFSLSLKEEGSLYIEVERRGYRGSGGGCMGGDARTYQFVYGKVFLIEIVASLGERCSGRDEEDDQIVIHEEQRNYLFNRKESSKVKLGSLHFDKRTITFDLFDPLIEMVNGLHK